MVDPARARQEREVLDAMYASRASLMGSHPFLASLAMQLDLVPVWDDRMKTAATDGRRIYLRPDFMLSRSVADRTFILAHEVLHCAMLHFVRAASDDPELWNIAMDHEVNDLLVRDGLTLPDVAILFEDCKGMSAEQVYDRFETDTERRAARRPADADVHLDGLSAPKPGAELDERLGPAVDEEAMEAWPGRVRAALDSTRDTPFGQRAIERRLVELLRESVVPWRAVLNSFLVRATGGSASWLPPARRHLHRGVYLPSRRGERLRVAIAIDTSGSTTLYQAAFLTEVAAIVASFPAYELTLIDCDDEIGEVREYSEAEPLRPEELSLPFGGATDLCPPFHHLVESGATPSVMLYLTDGLGQAPARPPPWPVLWVLVPEGTPPAEWGEVLILPGSAAAEE